MRVAITERFLDDLLALAPPLARKCRELIRELEHIPASEINQRALPGWRLHKLRSSPFLSLSVDMNYRMLVKVDSDTAFVHRVVKHDLADSERINRNDSSAPLCGLVDADLRWHELADALEALGLDATAMSALRNVHSEDDFLGVLATLPGAWPETALSLFEMSAIHIPRAKFRILAPDEDFQLALEQSEWEIYLHPSQQCIVDLPSTQRIAVAGSAGTGKTVCGWHRARRLTYLGGTVAFVAPNANSLEVSKRKLTELLDGPDINAYFLVPTSAYELGELAKVVDHTIIDEAQEISPQWLADIAPTITGKNSGITLLYDLNQLRGSIPPNDHRRYSDRISRWNDALRRLGCSQLTLSVNYRNSREIAACYTQVLDKALIEPLHCEVPAFEAGEVVRVAAKHGREAELVLCEAVRRLRLNYRDSDIAVVSVVPSAALLNTLRMGNLPAYSTTGGGTGVLVSTPELIRGHERRAVIVIGPEDCLTGKNYGYAVRSYISMSRARERLVVITTE